MIEVPSSRREGAIALVKKWGVRRQKFLGIFPRYHGFIAIRIVDKIIIQRISGWSEEFIQLQVEKSILNLQKSYDDFHIKGPMNL